MEQVTTWLRPDEDWVRAWLVVSGLCGAYLTGLGLLIFLKPGMAKAVLGGFAGGLLANSFEALVRAIAGVALMGVSPDTRFPAIFFVFGAFLLVSAIPMALLPRTHRRFASWAVPFALRIMPLFGALSIIFGALLLWAVFA